MVLKLIDDLGDALAAIGSFSNSSAKDASCKMNTIVHLFQSLRRSVKLTSLEAHRENFASLSKKNLLSQEVRLVSQGNHTERLKGVKNDG